MKKKYVLISVVLITALISVILFLIGKNTNFVIALGGLTFFLVAALFDPPPKHKDFSYKDLEQSTFRALGGGGMLDIPKPSSDGNKKNNSTTE